MNMERAAALTFHRYKIVLDDGLEVVPGSFIVKATQSLTLCVPQDAIKEACDRAAEPFALSREEFVALCVQYEDTAVDLAKLRDDVEVLAKHGSGVICRADLRSVLRCAGENFNDQNFDEFFDMLVDPSVEQHDFATIDALVSQMDPFRLSCLLDAVEVDEASARNFKTLRSEPTERQLIIDAFLRERDLVPQKEKEAAEKRRKDEERRNAMPPVPNTAPVIKAPAKQQLPPQKAKAKSGCC